MIVRPHPAGWRITLHAAHGLLAAALYTQLEERLPVALRLPTLLAVAQHDDHQLDFTEGDYLTAGGAPKDFTQLAMDDAQRSLQASRLLQEAYRKHAWTYLLIGKHYTFLYREQAVDKRLRELLLQIEDRSKQLLQERSWKARELERTYQRMRFCDRLSLILCGEEVPAMGRELEINDALGKPHYVKQFAETDSLSVRPWPFAGDSFEVRGESFVLPELVYDDSRALGRRLAEAVAEERCWKFTKSLVATDG